MSKPISQRAYAKHRGVALAAVQRAISSGRLKHSLTVDAKGHSKILSIEAADSEWVANTRASAANASDEPTDDEAERLKPDDQASYAEARRRREIESLKQSRIASEQDELSLGERRGDLISVTVARAAIITEYTELRTKILGIPSRARQRIPKLKATDVLVLTELVREALESLADGE